jgi:hypothetical protein
MRHEVKYILTPMQYVLLQNRLKWVLQPDEHAAETGTYFIRSIYFDSPDRLALKEKQNGVNRRKKYRIRFYNGNAEHCRLECKEKTGTRIQKISESLTKAEAEDLLAGRGSVCGEEGTLLQRMQMHIASEGFEPIVTVDYVREAYVLPLSELRITFDKEVAWGPVKDCLIHERYLSNIFGDHVILEVKYNEYLPEHISAILASVGPVQTAASKYVACVESQFAAKGY